MKISTVAGYVRLPVTLLLSASIYPSGSTSSLALCNSPNIDHARSTSSHTTTRTHITQTTRITTTQDSRQSPCLKSCQLPITVRPQCKKCTTRAYLIPEASDTTRSISLVQRRKRLLPVIEPPRLESSHQMVALECSYRLALTKCSDSA